MGNMFLVLSILSIIILVASTKPEHKATISDKKLSKTATICASVFLLLAFVFADPTPQKVLEKRIDSKPPVTIGNYNLVESKDFVLVVESNGKTFEKKVSEQDFNRLNIGDLIK